MVADLMLSEQHHQIDDVLLVDVDDLQFLQHQVGQAQGKLVDPQAPFLPAHDMAHIQFVEENVDMRLLAPGIEVDLAAQHEAGGQRCLLRLESQFAHEELIYLLLLFVVGGEIKIGQDPVHRDLQVMMNWAMDAEGHRPQQPQMNTSLLGRSDGIQGQFFYLFVIKFHVFPPPYPEVKVTALIPFLSISTITPLNTPSPYSLPGLRQVVRPNFCDPLLSCMWPCSPSRGWYLSMALR